jgi:predicted ATPase
MHLFSLTPDGIATVAVTVAGIIVSAVVPIILHLKSQRKKAPKAFGREDGAKGDDPKSPSPEGLLGLHLEVGPRREPPRALCGRISELESLKAFSQRTARNAGGLYWLIGEMGVGKTAIFEQIKWWIEEQTPQVYLLHGQCQEGMEQKPFFPILDALLGFFKANRNSEELEKLRELAPRLHAEVRPASDSDDGDLARKAPRPLFTQTSPILEARAFLDWLLEQRPVVLMIEDVHWIDQGTVQLLDSLFARTPRPRLCGMVSVRAEALEDNGPLYRLYQDLQLSSHVEYRKLGPLDEVGVHDMLAEQFGESAIADRLAPIFWRESGGIPLVVENAIPKLEKSGLIKRSPDGTKWCFCADDVQLRALLQEGKEAFVDSRLRDLNSKEMLLLSVGSVEGAEFDSQVVAMAGGIDPADAEECLRRLSGAKRFIFPVGEEKTAKDEPSTRFRFSHWFYQDCIRRKVTPTRRRQFSGQVAEALESEFPSRSAQNALELAELYRIAGIPEKERLWRVRAAVQQLSLSGYAEAIESSNRAATLFAGATEQSDLEAYRDVMVVEGVCFAALKGYASEEASQAYRMSIEISRSARLPAHFPSLYGVWMNTLVRGIMKDAIVLAREMLDLASAEERLAVDRTQAHWAMGVTQYFMGQGEAARTNFEEGIRLYDPARHAYHASCYVLDPGVANRYLLARALWFLGFPDRSVTMVEESLQLARQLNHVESLAFALVSAAIVYSIRGEVGKVQECVVQLLKISGTDELRQHSPWARILGGWAVGAQGDAAAGLEELHKGLETYEARGAKLALSGFYAMEGDLYHRAKLFDEEARVIDKAMRHMEETGQRYYYAELLRLQVRNLDNRGLSTGVRQRIAALEEARQVAIGMHSRSVELRIVTDLTATHSVAGDDAEGLRVLEEFLSGFIEGRDTEDGKRAIQLCDSLRTKLA